MTVTGESIFISAKQGTKKDGSTWFMLKFLDNDADEFFSVFVDEKIFSEMSACVKHTPVLMTLNIVPGSKYFDLANLEVVM